MLKFVPIEPPLRAVSRSNDAITLIVMHATDGSSVEGTIETLRDRRLAYHYIIDRDGTVYTAFGSSGSWKPQASHAGNSYGPNEAARQVSRVQNAKKEFVQWPSVNGYSIGIAFANFESKGEKLTPKQIEAAEGLIAALKAKVPTLKWITTHAIVSPGRKTDPKFLDIDALGKAVGLPVWRFGA